AQGLEIERWLHRRMGQQHLRLRCKQQRVIEDAPVQRLFAETVTSDEQTAVAAVPQSKREHAVEFANHAIAVLLVKVRQHFRVRSAAKRMSTFLESRAQLAIVVELA